MTASHAESTLSFANADTLGPNMAFIALRGTASVRAMVRTWWNIFAGSFDEVHPFEQHTLQWQVMHLDHHRRKIQTLSLRTMDPSYPDAVVHLDHNAGTKTRIWVMVGAVADMLTELADAEVVSSASRNRRGGDKGKDGVQAPLAQQLALLRMPRKGLAKARRRPVIEAIVHAAQRDLKRSGRACRPRVIPFNATSSAMTHMWEGSLGVDRMADHLALAGMPLQLANCSDDPLHAPWQTWVLRTEQRTAKGGSSRCDGLCLTHKFVNPITASDHHPPAPGRLPTGTGHPMQCPAPNPLVASRAV